MRVSLYLVRNRFTSGCHGILVRQQVLYHVCRGILLRKQVLHQVFHGI